MNRENCTSCLLLIVFIGVTSGLFGATASAVNILWDGTGTSWNVASNWSLFSNATTPNPAAKPGAGDTAIFNIETVNTPQTVNLNTAQSALGLVFNSTGSVSIQSGIGTNTLTLGSGGISVSPGAGVNTINPAISVTAPQAWANDSSNLLSVSGSVSLGANNLTVGGGGNTLIGGTLSGTNGLAKIGAGQLTLGAANTFSGGVAISAGNVQLNHAGALNSTTPNAIAFGSGSTGSLSLFGNNVTVSGITTDAVVGSPVVQNGSAVSSAILTIDNAADVTYAGVLQNGGIQTLGLTKLGAGTLALSGNLPYTGQTKITEGTLKLTGPDNPLGGGLLTLQGGGKFDLNGRSAVLSKLSLEGSGFNVLKSTASGNATLTIPVNSGMDDRALSVVGANEGTIEVTQSDGNLTLDGRLHGSGTVYKHGAGTLILKQSSASTFYGTVTVEQGTLAIGHNVALGLTGAFEGRLSLLGGAVRAEGGARVIANRVLLNSPHATFTGSDDLTLTGVISGAGQLTKQGAGKLTLDNASTYTGGTTVDAGTLVVNGSIAGGVVVNTTGTLGGTGVVDGAVTANSGSTLAPGASAGKLKVGSLAMQDGSTLTMEIGGLTAGSQHDQLESSGALSLDGSLVVSLINGFTPTLGQTYDLLNWGTLSGAFDLITLPTLGSGMTWNTSSLYASGVLIVTSAGIPGDYNNNGTVDAADYTRYRDALGTNTVLPNDTTSGSVSTADYAVWQTNFGQGASSAASTAVPEPSALFVLLITLLFSICLLTSRVTR